MEQLTEDIGCITAFLSSLTLVHSQFPLLPLTDVCCHSVPCQVLQSFGGAMLKQMQLIS